MSQTVSCEGKCQNCQIRSESEGCFSQATATEARMSQCLDNKLVTKRWGEEIREACTYIH